MPGSYPTRVLAQGAGNESARRAASAAGRTAASVARQELANRGARALAKAALPISARGLGLLIPVVDVAVLAWSLWELYRWWSPNNMAPVSSSYGYQCGAYLSGPTKSLTTCGQTGVSPSPGLQFGPIPANTWGVGNPPSGSYWYTSYWDTVPDGAHLARARRTDAWTGKPAFWAMPDNTREPSFHPAQYPALFPWALPIQSFAPVVKPIPWVVVPEVRSDPFPQGLKVWPSAPPLVDYPQEAEPLVQFPVRDPDWDFEPPREEPPKQEPRRPIVLPIPGPRRRSRRRRRGNRPTEPPQPQVGYAVGIDQTYPWAVESPAVQDAINTAVTTTLTSTTRTMEYAEYVPSRPPPGAHEIKVRSNRGAIALWNLYNLATEARDLSNALYWALPKVKTKKGKLIPKYKAFNDWQRFMAVWDHHDEVDVVEAIFNAQRANLTDRFAAASGRAQGLAQAAADNNRGGVRPSLGAQTRGAINSAQNDLKDWLHGPGKKAKEKYGVQYHPKYFGDWVPPDVAAYIWGR